MLKRLTTLVAVGLIAASCSSPTTDATTTTTDDVGSTATTNPAGGSAASSSTSSVSVEPSGGESLEACMVGTWELDAAAFFEVITASLAGSEGPGEFVHLGGVNQVVASEDGTFVDQRVDWRFGVVTDFGNLEMNVNHTQTGTWSASGDVISTTITDAGTPEFTMAIDGLPFEVPGGALPVEPPEAVFDEATGTCTATTLTVEAAGITSTWTRSG
jgi:hypothetical protein